MWHTVHWTPTFQPRSQFSAEEHVCQLALLVALLTLVVFIKVDVVKVYTACQRNNPGSSLSTNHTLKSRNNRVSFVCYSCHETQPQRSIPLILRMK